MKTLLLASAIAFSGSSYAWGDREQGILAGVLLGTVIHNSIQRPAPQIVQPPQQLICGYNVHCQPQPQQICRSYPQYDYHGRVTHYLTYCTNN